MREFIKRTDESRTIYYNTKVKCSEKVNQVFFLDMKILNMLVYVDIFQYIPSKYRQIYYSKENVENDTFSSKGCGKLIRKFISKKIVKLQKRTLRNLAKNFSNNVSNYDVGLIHSNLSNLISKKRIEIPNICHIFRLKIPYSLFFNKMYNKTEIENFFLESGKKTDRFIFFEKAYIENRIGINLSGKTIRNVDFSPNSKIKRIQTRMAEHLENLYTGQLPSSTKKRNNSYLQSHIYNESDELPKGQIDRLDNLEIRFSLLRNEELNHLRDVNSSICYYSISGDSLEVKEYKMKPADAERDFGEYYEFNVFYSFTNERIKELNQ